MGRRDGIHSRQCGDHDDPGRLIRPELCVHGRRRAAGNGGVGGGYASVIDHVFADGQHDVSGVGMLPGRVRTVAGVCAHAAACRQTAGYRSGSLRRRSGTEHDDWPDHPTVWHFFVFFNLFFDFCTKVNS